MKWQDIAKEAFPNLKPARPAGFTLSSDGKSVLVSLYDEKVVLVLNNKTDLFRIRGMVDAALVKRDCSSHDR